MAKVDELLTQVTDTGVRSQLVEAVKDLKRRRRFGLVYEEHIPETALCASDVGLAVGAEAMLRKEPDDATHYRVESVAEGKATIADGHTSHEVIIDDLLVVKRFGDPVYPVLRPTTESVERDPSKPYHTVLNGENFHALQLLLFGCENKIDCIYIDPPYNTRGRDWKYNNDYVDPVDSWHHSKWLSMMEKRLKLARRLLKPDGVLVVMIDEHELHHLGLLLEQLFPDYLRYVVSIVINGRGSTGNRNFASIEERALFVVPSLGYDLISAREGFIPDFHPSASEETLPLAPLLAKVANAEPDLIERLLAAGVIDDDDADEWRDVATLKFGHNGDTEQGDDDLEAADEAEVLDEDDPAAYWRGAVRTGQGTSFRTQRPNQFYPLYIDSDRPDEITVGEPLLERDENGTLVPPSWEQVGDLVPIWPVDEDGEERVWCFEPRRMAAEIGNGNIKVGRFNPKRNTYAVNVRRVRRTRQRFRERTIWWEKSYDAGSNGTNVLKRLLGASGMFDFPKSVYAVRDVLACVLADRPDALVLDYFAGSGTTLHATSLLNTVDGGRRRCILVTNNEVSYEFASKLHEEGRFRGDPDYEAMGICRRVTVPRVVAALTGLRADGTPIPGKHKWAGQRPFADGFPENAAFYDLAYENPDLIEIGERFADILPTLWLTAGAVGDPSSLKADERWFLAADRPFAVLLDEDFFFEFATAVEQRADLTHIWLVTDSEAAFGRMRSELSADIEVGMLYRDYLRSFRINVEF